IAARLHNQSQSNRDVRLFETANVYLSQTEQLRGDQLPKEQYNFGCIAESEPRLVRGVFEEMIDRIWGQEGPVLEERMVDFDFLDKGSSIAWFLQGSMSADMLGHAVNGSGSSIAWFLQGSESLAGSGE
ncbi:MAG: hypothetical protein NT168_05670, partial [Planctomycetota bacterium]|nr:hypothetical protein [Planctomycetota bacterium]